MEVVINQSLARRLWPNGGAVGGRLTSANARFTQIYTVVGIVNDVRLPGPRDPVRAAQVYRVRPVPPSEYIVRTALPGALLVPTLRQVFTDVDPHAFVQTVTVGERFLRDALAPTTFGMALLTAFSMVALLLSAVGLYGVIAYSVTQRTREIGVRVALGADARAVAALVARGALALTFVGVAAGVAAGAASTRVLTNLLYGISAADPITFMGVGVLVLAIALLASWVPTWRALRIDPIVALRMD
jgi:putative ABC transport system permease protein